MSLAPNSRLLTKDGHYFTNARIIKQREDGVYIICTDCFNILHMDKETIEEFYDYPDGSDFEDKRTTHEFIKEIEMNIENVKQQLSLLGIDK